MIDTGNNTGKTAFAAALATVIIGVGVLAGWLFELEFLKRIAPGLVAMNPATAAAFILAGASLALFLLSPRGKDQKPRALILTARLCALVVTLIGLAKLTGILCGWDLGVDRWLFASQLTDSVRFPNRMAPNTAFNFLLLGGALLFVDVKNRSARFWSEFSVVLVGFGSLLAVLAYVYDIQSFYGLSAFIPMALHTAITFLVLVVAFLLSHTDSGLLAVFVGDSAGGTMARRLLPAAVLVPAVFGWLTLQGEKAGIYHGQLSDAVFAVGNILVFAFLVCWSAKELFSADLGRKKAEEALHDSQALYHSLVDQMPAGIFRKDAEGRYVFVNSLFCQVMEMSVDQILGKTSSELVACMSATQATRRPVSDKLETQGMSHHESVMRTGRPIVVADEYQGSDGRRSYYHTVKSPVFGPDGKIVGTQGMLFDITERKQAEAELSYERDLLRALLDNLPDQIYFKDAQSHFLKASKTQAENFGLKSADELVGKTDFDFFTEEHARPAFEDEQEIIRTGRPLIGKVEKEVLKGGRESWALTSKMPFRNKDGQIIGTFGISKNITAIKQVEAELAYQRDLLGTLMNYSPDSIFFKNLQSQFVRLSRSEVNNLRRVALIHYHASHRGDGEDPLPPHLASVEEFEKHVIGKSDAEIYGRERAGGFGHDEAEIMRTGQPMIGKIEQTICPDGSTIWFMTTKVPWRNKDGEIIGTFGTAREITDLKNAEAKLEQVYKQLLETSRQAGMAEVATGVLHNVGNVLNSVNVSSTLLVDLLKRSKIGNVGRVAALMQGNAAHLGEFMIQDPKGRKIPAFLADLAKHLALEQVVALKELAGLHKNIEHIKEIVTMQQSYAKVSGVTQAMKVQDLIEEALRMNEGALARHGVQLVRDYKTDLPEITVDKHTVMQILINLMRNAKYACDDAAVFGDKQITVRASNGEGRVKISVIDNGIGIPPENLTRIFSHGFTTRKGGHGFGLHSGALAAKGMGGSLTVHSDGPGQGATFTLELPVNPK
jgi:PAS domain S-box-containing protein